MPKRRRGSSQPISFKKRRSSLEVTDDEEDEIAVAIPDMIARRHFEESQQDSIDDDNEADEATQMNEVDVANGMVTPLGSEVSRSRSFRKNSDVDKCLDSSATGSAEENTDSSGTEKATTETPHKVQRVLSHVEFPGWRSGPAFPRRLYGWRPKGLDTVPERQALSDLMLIHEETRVNDDDKPDYTYLRLDQFSIYKPTDNYKHALTMVALHELSRDRHQEFSFDGVLCIGEERRYVQDVRFRLLTVDEYDNPDATDMENQICIQSVFAARRHEDVWYQLGSPSPEYQRFYQPFLWVARFTKHVVQYMLITERVTLNHFRNSFFDWLDNIYGEEESFLAWSRAVGSRDFAIHFVAYVDFLWKECHGVQQPEDDIKICKHPIWRESLPYTDHLKAIPRQHSKQHDDPKTVVTPFAFESFRNMYFAEQLLETTVSEPKLLARVGNLKAQRGLAPWYSRPPPTLTPPPLTNDKRMPVGKIKAGDVVAVPPDVGGQWKSGAETWYAYVQRVWRHENGQRRLDVIWLYHPEDTTIGKARYMFSNELFFSDNCGCGRREALYAEEVQHKVDVCWNPCDPFAQEGFFVRQKFRTVAEMDHYDFRKLQDTDFRCCHHADHNPEPESKFQVGEAVLVQKRKGANSTNCEPAQIMGFADKGKTVQLRRLLRKKDVSQSSRPNELLLSAEIVSRSCDRLVRECHVRHFSKEEYDAGLPAPYDRDGAGDYYFVIGNDDPLLSVNGRAHDADEGLPAATCPPLRQAWNPLEPSPYRKLRGLGIFCGGGTFDRGLQEGGAVRFTHAVDYAEHALHSYKANASDPVKFFLGSVDDYLSNAMSGTSIENTASAGEIEVISAGSPCQGFSRLQLDTASPRSLKNASMVASVVSFVDFYVPEYLILENVVSMTESIKERKEQNVFSQILAALVGLGYQVQQFLMDAWSYGSPQQRSRVFIIATAPSAAPLSQPECTHAHPIRNLRTKKLGTSSNGLPFGTRMTEPFTPLPFVTAEQSVADLPTVYDSVPQLCTRFPDHRLAVLEPPLVRARIAMVPTRPRGWGLVQAQSAHKLRGEPAEYFERTKRNLVRSGITSKSYARVYPDHLFPTIVTKLCVGDGMNGRTLHWDQHRPLTVMEARRALGYLDHEVLIGTPSQQLHIVGNSVDRKVALVLGLALRESWLKTNRDLDDNIETRADGSDAVKRAASHHSALDEGAVIQQGFDEAASPPQDSTDGDFSSEDELAIDNRTVKMSLNLTQEEIEGVRKATEEHRGGFKEILRLMQSREEHLAARDFLHGGEKKALHKDSSPQ